MMKKSFLVILMAFLVTLTFAQTKDEQDVAQAVEKLKKAMIDADKNVLESLASDKLSYGHSTGRLEDKKLFVDNIVNNKSDFVSIDLSNQTISVAGDVALVRHKFDAVTHDDGKPGEAHLFVLIVWQKQNGQWKLLARQAVKQPAETAH